MNVKSLEKIIIAAVALHSIVLGVAMLVDPVWTLELCGWKYDGDIFFPQQAGVFLVIFGGAYVVALWRRPFAWFLVASKAAAVAFLLAEYLAGAAAPATLLVAGLFDGMMGLAVAVVLMLGALSRGARPVH